MLAPRLWQPLHAPPFSGRSLEAFLISVGLVSLAEIGDKTMLLAGTLAAPYLDGPWTKRIVGIAFLGFAGWA